MRSLKTKRSPLRYPLDRVLGSQAQIRILRVLLYESQEALSASAVQRLGGLSPYGTRNALQKLVDAGIIERSGDANFALYQSNRHHPLRHELATLFESEENRFSDFVNGLRQAASLPEVEHAWLRNVLQEDGVPIEMVVVAELHALPWIDSEIRKRLLEFESAYDQIVEVIPCTRADAPPLSKDALHLWGHAAEQKPSRRRNPERSHHLAKAISTMLQRDPTLRERAKRHIARLLQEDQGTARGDLAEWEQLLNAYSTRRLGELITADSSRSERLRRSMPFFAVLNHEEREDLLRQLEENM